MPTAEKLARETPGNPQFDPRLMCDPVNPLGCPTISGRHFTWNKETGNGCTEISDLQWTHFPPSFYIESHRTGEKRLFLRSDELRSDDNECQGFKYFVPGGNIEVTLFND